MALSFSALRDAVESDLRDGSNTYHDAEDMHNYNRTKWRYV